MTTTFQEGARNRPLRIDLWGNAELHNTDGGTISNSTINNSTITNSTIGNTNDINVGALTSNSVEGSLLRVDSGNNTVWRAPSFGTATQLTSNTTSVALDARAGIVTMFAVLAGTTKVTFDLLNNLAVTGGMAVVTPDTSGIVSINIEYPAPGGIIRCHVFNHDVAPTAAPVKVHFITMSPTTTH